ncbi:hypothetical protein K435DRAFT_867232 [Dendrothele bispora CBS 962.96]|uniref:Uncharacterized protein n=1 Tax=Dendrothele bispora (strain CBS 962.96) TaxID=1314807 RepID=A0A4S8LEX1_DENBC|nr:hypothetical protein K435DRAFT_867232 [Dendrothele bispora CBS 962.96]
MKDSRIGSRQFRRLTVSDGKNKRKRPDKALQEYEHVNKSVKQWSLLVLTVRLIPTSKMGLSG